MLIQFKSDIAGQFIMMGDVALPLLRLAGLSGNTQGAVSGDDLHTALQTLEGALQHMRAVPEDAHDDESDNEPPVAINRRAMPLLEMLQKAKAAEGYVMWQPD